MTNTPQHSNSQKNPFTELEPTWKKWLIECIQRGCTAESMVESMVKDGPFNERIAKNIISAARYELYSELEIVVEPECPRPDIDTRLNHIDLDRRIDILITVDSPRIVVMGNVLSNEECDALIAYAERSLVRSLVAHADSAANIEDSTRTSSYAVFQRGETELLLSIEKRLESLANWPVEKGEGIQVLNYKAGEFYRPHFDWFDANLSGHQERLKQGGQRLGTFVLYLSDVEEGGCTSFPKLEIDVRPHRGMAVFFTNIEAGGNPDPLTYHGAEPVIRGVKWVATKWLRAERF